MTGRFRVTIGELMGAVLVLALVAAASADEPLPPVVAALLALILVNAAAGGVAVLGIIYGRGPRRGFWVGFLAFTAQPTLYLLYLLLAASRSANDRFFLCTLASVVPFGWIGGRVGARFAASGADEGRGLADRA